MFESEEEIGGTFRYRSYENSELVSSSVSTITVYRSRGHCADIAPCSPTCFPSLNACSKQLTAFTDFRFSRLQGDHVSLNEYCAYLERYATHFNLWDDINLKSKVVWIEKKGDVHHVTVSKHGDTGPSMSERSRVS